MCHTTYAAIKLVEYFYEIHGHSNWNIDGDLQCPLNSIYTVYFPNASSGSPSQGLRSLTAFNGTSTYTIGHEHSHTFELIRPVKGVPYGTNEIMADIWGVLSNRYAFQKEKPTYDGAIRDLSHYHNVYDVDVVNRVNKGFFSHDAGRAFGSWFYLLANGNEMSIRQYEPHSSVPSTNESYYINFCGESLGYALTEKIIFKMLDYMTNADLDIVNQTYPFDVYNFDDFIDDTGESTLIGIPDHYDLKEASLLAVEDLCNDGTISDCQYVLDYVTNAWYAIGVGNYSSTYSTCMTVDCGETTWGRLDDLFYSLINRSVFVTAGNTLNFKKYVFGLNVRDLYLFDAEGEVIIESGGKLILDDIQLRGSDISGSEPWEGITVLGAGNTNRPHISEILSKPATYPTNNSHHGVLIKKDSYVNNATIKFPTNYTFDDNCSPNYPNTLNTQGGIIIEEKQYPNMSFSCLNYVDVNLDDCLNVTCEEANWVNSGNTAYDQIIYVEAGAHLIIDNQEIKFTENGGIIVEAGGKLTIRNGAVLKGKDENTQWKGITVLGANNQVFPTENVIEEGTYPHLTTEQGVVVIEGGETAATRVKINHAKIALNAPFSFSTTDVCSKNYSPTNISVPTSGGIILAKNVDFEDNERDVVMDNGEQLTRNPSVFEGNVFNRNLNNTQYSLSFTGFNDLQFIENSILGNEVTDITQSDEQRGMQLIEVSGRIQYNNFSNLGEGIYRDIIGAGVPFNVSDNIFTKVRRGLYSMGGSGTMIDGNDFLGIPKSIYEYGDDYYGIYLIDEMTFDVTDNDFEGLPQYGNPHFGDKYTYGIAIHNSSMGDCNINNNRFIGTDYGCSVQEDNSFLQIGCNLFAENGIPHYYGSLAVVDGKLSNQGIGCDDIFSPAGNEWKYWENQCDLGINGLDDSHDLDIVTGILGNSFTYFAHKNSTTNRTVPDELLCMWEEENNVIVNPCSAEKDENACGTDVEPIRVINHKEPGDSVTQLVGQITLELYELYGTNDKDSLTIDSTYSVLDGGNTPYLKTVVEDPNANNNHLVQQLNGYDFLSDEVLLSSINKNNNAFSSAELTQILTPQVPLSSSILEALQNRPIPLGNSDWQSIMALQGYASTPRNIVSIQRDLRSLQHQIQQREKNLLRLYSYLKNDNEYLNKLQTIPYAMAKKQLVAYYLGKYEYANARLAIDEFGQWIPDNRQIEYNAYRQLMNILIDGKENNGYTAQELTDLQSIANSNTEASVRAKAVLNRLQSLNYYEPIRKIESNHSAKRAYNKILTDDINIYPNPSNTFLYINTDLTFEGSLHIYNILGKSQIVFDIKRGKQLTSLNVEEWKAGIYIYNLIDSKGNKRTGKLIVE